MFTVICKLALFSSLASAQFKGFTPEIHDPPAQKPEVRIKRERSPRPKEPVRQREPTESKRTQLEAQRNAQLLAEARAAYANGDFKGAIAKFEALPQTASQFLRSREELAWAYLRADKMDRLRGLLAHLNSKAVPMRMRLEGRVLSAMLYLRDCQYERSRFEIEAFQAEMSQLAKTVERNQRASASKPYWNALGAEMSEAILKMRFVKMELRSRLIMLDRGQTLAAAPSPVRKEPIKVAANTQVFPMNGEIWQDEIFRARGMGSPYARKFTRRYNETSLCMADFWNDRLSTERELFATHTSTCSSLR